ncbi:MAG TPA: UDP-glucuronic acid decarboxylase family protein [Candidatus Saccharimonadales bacterium]|nr:UDP-glucuronic acid decarboxylase family protein [Candidatus Saccharimonadales bacterium]
MSKQILVTGAAGFLGSHLCDYYLEQGDTVVGIDNLSTGLAANLKHLKANKKFTFVKADITEDLPATVMGPFDIILNMASPASPPHYQRLGLETLRVGSEGTLRMLELARKHKARFFHASTSEVYGDPEVHPQPETYKGSVNCYGPRSMYDESKRYAEALIWTHRKKYGTNTVIARFFNTYGPRMDPRDGRVVSNFIVQALKDEPLTVYGDGSQTRSFCYVDDLVNGITALIDSGEEGPINLGNPSEFTVKELAEIVLQKTGSKSKLTFYPLPGDDPLQRKPVISLAKQKLGWEPRINLMDGLDKTISYFQEVLA